MQSNSNNLNKLTLSKVRELLNYISNSYGVDTKDLENNYFYITNSDKVYLSNQDLDKLNLNRVSNIGLYFGTYHDDKRFRLSIEGTRLIKPNKNYIVLKDESLSSYLAAENLFLEDIEKEISQDRVDFFIVTYQNNCFGCVSKKENQFLTYMPKNRKIDYNKVF